MASLASQRGCCFGAHLQLAGSSTSVSGGRSSCSNNGPSSRSSLPGSLSAPGAGRLLQQQLQNLAAFAAGRDGREQESSSRRLLRRGDDVVVHAARGRPRRGAGSISSDDEDEEEMRRRRLENLNEVIREVNQVHGKGTIMPVDANGNIAAIETDPTGCLPLDLALGGGWPRGRIVEIFGHESTGKTTLALHAIAQQQRKPIRERRSCVLIDAEHALDMSYAKRLGVVFDGPDRLIIHQPSHGEEAFDVADKMARSNAVSLIVVDSVAALVPKQEVEADIGSASLASQARLMSQGLRKLTANAAKMNCTVIFLNQIRQKVGIVFGNPEITPGGNALKFIASVRCETKSVERKKLGTMDVGFRCRTRVVKSKVSNPFRIAEFDILFGTGIQREGCVLDCAVELGLVTRRGAWLSYGDLFKANGREHALMALKENPELCDELEQMVRMHVAGQQSAMQAGAVVGADSAINNGEGDDDSGGLGGVEHGLGGVLDPDEAEFYDGEDMVDRDSFIP